MAVSIPEVLWISGMGYDRSEIPTGNPTFSTMPDSMVALLSANIVRGSPTIEFQNGGQFIYLFIMKIVHEVQDKPTMQQQ